MEYYYGIPLIIIGIIELFLGFFIFFRYQKQKIPLFYSLFIFGVAIWVIGNGLAYIGDLDFWARVTYVGATLLAAFFVLFTMVFPYQEKVINRGIKLLLLALVLVFSITIFIDGWFVESFTDVFGREGNNFGLLYYPFMIYIPALLAWGILLLVNKFKKSDGIHRWQLKYLLVGVIFSGVFGLNFNLILPALGVSYLGYIGPGSSIIWLGFTTYIILKK
ncbi:MAG: histidine kinase N-terminal 7TM domain-containing protein [Patescibacteria group bacterium]